MRRAAGLASESSGLRADPRPQLWRLARPISTALPIRRKLRAAAATALLGSAIAFPAFAQTYPAKPVRLMSGFPAGGANDYHARVLAQKLTEMFGHSVIVENRGGAGGTIAADFIAKA